MTRFGPLLLASLALALQGTTSLPAAAQQTRVSPFIPVGHWSVEAGRRLHGLGLMPPAYDPGVGSQSLAELASAFEAAAEAHPLASAYSRRLLLEMGDLVSAGGHGTRSAIGPGYGYARGRLLSGSGHDNEGEWTGPVPAEDRVGALVSVAHAGGAPFLAWRLDAALAAPGVQLREAYVTTAWGVVGLWAGVRRQAYETAPGAGVVLESLEPRPSLGVRLMDPVRLPWVLERVGPIRLTSSLVRARRNGAFEHPLLWTTRFMVEPHERLQIGVNRGIMFGGAGNETMTVRSLAYLLIGKHSGGFDNQVVALTVHYRAPLALLPLVAYLEWGLEDSAGAWRDVPGILAGVETPALPFARSMSMGVSTTFFDESCCGNPIWYRNWAFRGGWSDDNRPLGHSLGGHGREVRLYGRYDRGPRMWLSAGVYGRDRGPENLFAPAREGRSAGGYLRLRWLPLEGWEAGLDAGLEAGAGGGWREPAVEATLRALF